MRGRGSKHHNRRVRSGEQNGLVLFCSSGRRRLALSWLHPQATMMCGAERRTAMVVMMVKAVKVMRQNRSITIAANCTRTVQGQGGKEGGNGKSVFGRRAILHRFKTRWLARIF